MHTHFTDKVSEVRQHISQGDVQLGARRFLDCVLDTQNPEVFRSALELFDWMDENKAATVAALLEKMEPALMQLGNQALPAFAPFPVVTVQDAGKSYARGNFSLRKVSFRAQAGEIVGLVGENGNGKTTLLRVLAKELCADNGSVTYDFVPPGISQYDLRTRLVYIPQRIPRWYGTLMDNLQFTLTLHGIKGEDNRLWAEIMVARLGLRPYKHLGWNRISSGYKTRFELAKNLLRKPQLFLLDEPLANLDILAQQTILQDLKQLSQSHTQPFAAVLSSQQLFEVEKVSDLVIFLKNGEPRYQRSTSESADRDEVIFEMEAKAGKEDLLKTFSSLGITRIVNNGGVYISHFPNGTRTADIYRAISASGIEFNYVRNISQSSRRYFVD